MKVICISGKAQHGKDYTADLLKNNLEHLGHSVLIIHYADLLKFVCEKYFGWDGAKDEKGRTLLQNVGTEIVRECDQDFWVDFVYNILFMFNDNWEYAIIPDCRFKNELLNQHGRDWCFDSVYHVRVNRINYDNQLTEEQKKHSSETELDDVNPDYLLINDGTEKYIEVVKQLTNTLINGIVTFGGK